MGSLGKKRREGVARHLISEVKRRGACGRKKSRPRACRAASGTSWRSRNPSRMLPRHPGYGSGHARDIAARLYTKRDDRGTASVRPGSSDVRSNRMRSRASPRSISRAGHARRPKLIHRLDDCSADRAALAPLARRANACPRLNRSAARSDRSSIAPGRYVIKSSTRR